MNWKKWTGIIAFLAIFAFVVYSIWDSSQEEQLPTVRTAETTEEDITEVVSTSGIIEPSQVQEVTGQGPVLELNVSVGETVEEDETLIVYADGTSIDANFDGTVTEVNVEEEEIDDNAQQGQASIVIGDLDNLQVEIEVSQADADLIEEEQNATLTYSEETFEGTVTEIDPVATEDQEAAGLPMEGGGGEGNATLDAIVTFDSDSDADDLIAGFDIDVDITIESVENALVLPIETLNYNEDNNPYVYVIEDGVASENAIETGIQSDAMIEVTEGLEAGETVILSPEEDVEDGVEVETESE